MFRTGLPRAAQNFLLDDRNPTVILDVFKESWTIWNRENYSRPRRWRIRTTYSGNLYTTTCKVMQGLSG